MVAMNLKAETFKLMDQRSAIESEMNVIIQRLSHPGGPGLTATSSILRAFLDRMLTFRQCWRIAIILLSCGAITMSSQNGLSENALECFKRMLSEFVEIDHHIGLLDEGCSFLSSMESDYGIPPRIEHYACAVDLCGRAGRLDWAEALIKRMPFEPDAMLAGPSLDGDNMSEVTFL
uniref:Pentatricopeptide repeat-containing protein n=1 Tax=Kalanchoe fedtschenkoi TaxID=63787 RepID=A0A7N0RJ61_KALFE